MSSIAAYKLMELARMSNANVHQVSFEYGELSEYDPTTNQAKFYLPMQLDQDTGNPIETGFCPIGTMLTGTNYGMQFPPNGGEQALVIFLDPRGWSPVAAVFFATNIESPPFQDGKSWGWIDRLANAIKTTVDGATDGDGAGGARVVGAGYASMVAPVVELGAEGLTEPGDGVVRQSDLQLALSQFKIAMINAEVPNSGGIDIPTAQGSTTVKAND